MEFLNQLSLLQSPQPAYYAHSLFRAQRRYISSSQEVLNEFTWVIRRLIGDILPLEGELQSFEQQNIQPIKSFKNLERPTEFPVDRLFNRLVRPVTMKQMDLSALEPRIPKNRIYVPPEQHQPVVIPQQLPKTGNIVLGVRRQKVEYWRIGIIGGGRMGRNFILYLLDKLKWPAEKIWISTRQPNYCDDLLMDRGVKCCGVNGNGQSGMDYEELLNNVDMIVFTCRPSALSLITAHIRPYLIQKCHFSFNGQVHTKAPKRQIILLNAIMNISDERWRRWLGLCEEDLNVDSGVLAFSLTSCLDEYLTQTMENADGKPQSPNRIDDSMRENRWNRWSRDIDRWLFFNKNGRSFDCE